MSGLVVPALLVSAFSGFISYWVTQGLKTLMALIAKYPALKWLDVSGWGAWITAFIVNAIVFYANLGLGLIPANYASIATTLLSVIVPLLVQVLTSNGVHATVKQLSTTK